MYVRHLSIYSSSISGFFLPFLKPDCKWGIYCKNYTWEVNGSHFRFQRWLLLKYKKEYELCLNSFTYFSVSTFYHILYFFSFLVAFKWIYLHSIIWYQRWPNRVSLWLKKFYQAVSLNVTSFFCGMREHFPSVWQHL